MRPQCLPTLLDDQPLHDRRSALKGRSPSESTSTTLQTSTVSRHASSTSATSFAYSNSGLPHRPPICASVAAYARAALDLKTTRSTSYEWPIQRHESAVLFSTG